VDALVARPYLADLAERPLLLTLMATLHTSWGQLPEDRADLYEETVKLLLSRWQRAREFKGLDREPVVEPGIAQVLAVDEGHVRTALHRLALRVHERQGEGEDRQARAADIGKEEVLLALLPLFKEGIDPDLVLRYLETRAGLLVGRSPGIYAFPHRSFQEYLAACHLADEAEFAAELRERVWEDPGWWREVFLLGVGKAKQGGLGNAVHVVNTLVPAGPGEVDECSQHHWQAAALAGQALLDLRFPKEAEGKPSFEAVLKRIQRWLIDLLATPDVLTPRERAEAGDVLGKLGDPRPGVGTIIVESKGETITLPDIHWVEVPSGPFLMGSTEDEEMAYGDEHPQHELHLPAFYIARYPITNAQYRPFVESGDYNEPRYWTEEGWSWRTGEREADLSIFESEEGREEFRGYLAQRGPKERDQPFLWEHPKWGVPNRPVGGVTWYEVIAYCNWLQGQYQMIEAKWPVWNYEDNYKIPQRLRVDKVRLPSEAEWEKAARGVDGRLWPWGSAWSEDKANIGKTNIRETCAVGVFPGGVSPFRVMDVVGNLWEWTQSRWGNTSILMPEYGYPYNPQDGREKIKSACLRVVRGASWNSEKRETRCAYRNWGFPESFFNFRVGFRVIAKCKSEH
jgi:formylglycine-generating enzyme required for sulfatase activity